ncbi:hypothetical protein [Haloquadratum walsbyi]|uniref:Uncharacterized protein n=1 Tax=Haloquadratum walsbyi (strain DSM 16790 / HBSQ001) TaxID=362976 RepID=Q18JS6_HALWD|nr:hypothetical protein [Haloquadratum walsbyi]CAJ51728.1 uncharacterized protein HQ_1600A [Haloquadratum walsbyi DSM 16790]
MSSFRRKLAIAIAMCATIGLTSGVSGFTAVTADRSTSVEIATQTSAYISFGDELACGNNDIITNNFADGTTLNEGEVTVTAKGGKLRFGPRESNLLNNGHSETFPENGGFSSDSLNSGGSVTIHVDSENTTAGSVTVHVDASGSAVAVNTTATVNVVCS